MRGESFCTCPSTAADHSLPLTEQGSISDRGHVGPAGLCPRYMRARRGTWGGGLVRSGPCTKTRRRVCGAGALACPAPVHLSCGRGSTCGGGVFVDVCGIAWDMCGGRVGDVWVMWWGTCRGTSMGTCGGTFDSVSPTAPAAGHRSCARRVPSGAKQKCKAKAKEKSSSVTCQRRLSRKK